MREKCSGDVSEQGESKPFENPGDEAITGPEQQADQEERVRWRPIERPDTREKLHDVSHAAEVRGDVDDIGDEEQRTGAPQYLPPPSLLKSSDSIDPRSMPTDSGA